MEFDLTEEQQDLQSFVRELLEQRSGSAAVRALIDSGEAHDQALWQVLSEQIGAAALAIPEQFGGAGFTTRESHLVLEELGRALTPSPFLGSVAIAAQALLATRNTDACERLLPSLASGERIAALAWASPTGAWHPSEAALSAARVSDDVWQLRGTVTHVLDGASADVVLAIARTDDGPTVFEVHETRSLQRTVMPTLDQTLHLATLHADGVAATPLVSPGSPAAQEVLAQIRANALTAIAANQVGTASRGLDMTVEYAQQRSQFGRLIGSFQALKHRMADMHVMLETARTTSIAATWAQSVEAPEFGDLALLAKVKCSEALSHIAAETIQLHGGIAITWEHDAHLVFKRAHAMSQLFGAPHELRQEVGTSLFD